MNLENEVLKMTCEFYGNFKFIRAAITFILDIFRNFIRNIYGPFLLNLLHERLVGAVSTEVFNAIDIIFDRHNFPLKKYSSDDKRLRFYEQLQLYTKPDICELQNKLTMNIRGGKITSRSTSITTVHLPLPNSLTELFEMDGLLDATLSNMALLQPQKNISSNLIHGSLWKEQV